MSYEPPIYSCDAHVVRVFMCVMLGVFMCAMLGVFMCVMLGVFMLVCYARCLHVSVL